MKTIAIIGGMGPQASIHAQTRLLNKLRENNLHVNIVHISLNVEPFFNGSSTFELSKEHKAILNGTKADIGFIACNTAHHFFEDFQNQVRFELVSIIEHAKLPINSVIFCSPTSKRLEIFGKNANYASTQQTTTVGKIIERINNGEKVAKGDIKTLVGTTKHPVFACTEISMCASNENLNGTDTLEQVLSEIIRRVR